MNFDQIVNCSWLVHQTCFSKKSVQWQCLNNPIAYNNLFGKYSTCNSNNKNNTHTSESWHIFLIIKEKLVKNVQESVEFNIYLCIIKNFNK